MSYLDFMKECERGLKKPCYLLLSSDSYLLKECLVMARSTIPEEERDFAYESHNAESLEQPVARIIDTLNTPSFFGAGKLVAIENAHKLKDADLEQIAAYLAEPADGARLLLLHIRDRSKTKRHREILSAVKGISVDVSDRELPEWAAARAESMGFEVERGALDILIGLVGGEAGLLASELEKLSHLGKSRIGREEVQDLVRGAGGYTVFDLADALERGDSDRVFKIQASIGESTPGEMLVGTLNWRFGRLAQRDPERGGRVLEIIGETDAILKSSGTYYPVELMLARILEISGSRTKR